MLSTALGQKVASVLQKNSVGFLKEQSPLGAFQSQILLGEVMKRQSLSSVRLFVSPCAVAHQTPLSMDFPGKNAGMGSHFLFQGMKPNPGIKSRGLHCRQTLYHLSHQGNFLLAGAGVGCVCGGEHPLLIPCWNCFFKLISHCFCHYNHT